MSLRVGDSVGPYRVTGLLGEGGMGAVYRAHDSKLNRDVAIKVLLPSVAHDADRLARFKREAQTLAALNHPHIAHVYGLEGGESQDWQGGKTLALVMEFVDGDTLADLIGRNPRGLPLDETCAIGSQIADALQGAHEQGIVHRDLKPANIKLTANGTVKVLDFGLAKLTDPIGISARDEVGQSPTITSPAMTNAGMILGTAAYMAPEQAKGRPVDRRADLWALGCVLYEMTTGRRPFVAEDVSDTLARVLLNEPEWTALPATTPASLRRLLTRCLEKDPRKRLDSAAAARLELDEALTESKSGAVVEPSARPAIAPRPAPRSRPLIPWALTALATIAALTVLVLWAPWKEAPKPERMTFAVEAGAGNFSVQLAISPDGRYLVNRLPATASNQLWLRPIDRLTGGVIAGTDNPSTPFFSWDSRRIYFFADGKLKVVSTEGGAPLPVTDGNVNGGGDENRNGTLLFSLASQTGLYRLDRGGQPAAVTTLDSAAGQISHRFPVFLPDGDHFLYLAVSTNRDASAIYVSSLSDHTPKRLIPSATKAQFAPPDIMLFTHDGELLAQRLDLKNFSLRGAPVHVAANIGTNVNGQAGFSVSRTGVLVYTTGNNSGVRQLTWVDRDGKNPRPVGPAGLYENPRLSHDGKSVAYALNGDVWIMDFERDNAVRKLTLDGTANNVPLWSPDDKRLAFISNRDGGIFNIYWKNASGAGSEDLVLKTANNKLLNDWSPDGQYLLYQEADPKTKNDLWMVSTTDRKAHPLTAFNSPVNEQYGSFSPDGKSIVYESDEGASRQVFVRHIADDSRWQVSTRGFGAVPRWSPTGKEVFYDAASPLMAVEVVSDTPQEYTFGVARQLFVGLQALPPHNFDVSRDGQHFLVLLSPSAPTAGAPIIVDVNWLNAMSLP